MAALSVLREPARHAGVTGKTVPDLRPTASRIWMLQGAVSRGSPGDLARDLERAGEKGNPCDPRGHRSFGNGSGGRDRTADKRIMIPLLYQLSYAATG